MIDRNQRFDIAAFRAIGLRNEKTILSSWKGDSSNPLVSVICSTYNHAGYLADSFRGFLIQETDFPFEIIVHDDASTDGTTDIVLDYARNYPKLIRAVVQSENQFSRGRRPMLLASAYAKGRYVALCEGDDLWFDKKKLQRQVDRLVKNGRAQLCFHGAVAVNGYYEVTNVILASSKDQEVDIDTVVAAGGGYMPTASLMIERSVLTNLPQWLMGAPVGDYFLQIYGSRRGALFVASIMSVYRIASEGSWSRNMSNDLDRFTSFTHRMNSVLNQVKQDLASDGISDKAFFYARLRLTVDTLGAIVRTRRWRYLLRLRTLEVGQIVPLLAILGGVVKRKITRCGNKADRRRQTRKDL